MDAILLIYPRQGGQQPANAIADDIRRRDRHFVWPIDSASTGDREFRMRTASCIILLAIPGWRSDSAMMDQLAAAERLGKDVIVVAYDDEPDLPLALQSAPRVSMSAAGGNGLDALHDQIVTELSDFGRLQRTQHRLQEARAALTEANSDKAAYLAELVPEFEKSAKQISEQLANLPAAQLRHAKAKAKEILEQRRKSRERRGAARPPRTARMIGREKEITALRSFLVDPEKSIALISGASGAGKTALAAYVLADASEAEHPGRTVVYKCFDATPASEFADVYEDLAMVADLVVEDTGAASVQLRIASLLDAFPEHPEEPYPVLLVDGVDGSDWFRSGQRRVDRELLEFLSAAAGKRPHGLKIIVTTTGLSDEIEQLARSPRVIHLRLDEGLSREQALDLMTKGDLVPLQLRNLSEPQVDEIMLATSGMPQSLVTVRAILACSDSTLEEVLRSDHLAALINKMLERLSRTDRSILEALAIFGMPVGKTAIDDVIIAVDGYIDSASSLDWLARRSIIICNEKPPEPIFDLHSAVRHEIIRLLQQTEKGLAPFGIFSRLRRLRKAAARYLRDLEQPLSDCRDIDDIRHYRARFALYLQLEEFKKASSILKDIEPFLRERGAHLVLLQLASELANSSQAPRRIKTAARRVEAYALWALGRPREALRWQNAVLREARPTREDLLAKGRCLRTLGQFADASKVLCEALEIEAPERNDSLEAELWCERARCSERQGFLNEALAQFDRAIELSVERPERQSEYFCGKADVQLSWVQPERARSDLELAADYVPSGGRRRLLAQADILALQGRVEFLFGDYQEAERMLKETVKLRRIYGPQPVLEASFTRLGRLHMLLGRLDLAADLVRQATYWLELRNGSDYQATILAAQISAQQDDWRGVERSLSPIVGLLPEHGVMVRGNLIGLACLGLGRPTWAADRFRDALKNSEEWLERCATNPEVIRQRALAMSGLAVAENRPQADAVAAFEDLCTITRYPGATLWNTWWARRLQAAAAAYADLDCVVAAAEGRIDPKEQSRLRRIEAEIGKAALEKIITIRTDRSSIPVHDFARRVDQAIYATCAIQNNDKGIGTGFLIGPDLVLTNFHVVEEYLAEGPLHDKGLVCRFDYVVLGDVLQRGIRVGLAPRWCIAHRRYSQADLANGASTWGADELDYAILALERPFGNEAGPDDDEPRGWIELGRLGKIGEVEDPVFVVQHSQPVTLGPQQRMEMTDGAILSLEGHGMRLRHSANTYKGASGSMCLDVHFSPIALHHAAQPDDERPPDWPAYRGEYNQAIPLHLIAGDLLHRRVLEEDDDGRLLPGPLARGVP